MNSTIKYQYHKDTNSYTLWIEGQDTKFNARLQSPVYCQGFKVHGITWMIETEDKQFPATFESETYKSISQEMRDYMVANS